MSLRWGTVFLSLATGLAQEDHCQVDNIDRWDCAPDQASCSAAGCCWAPATTKDTPWCFYPDNVPNPCVGDNVYNWDAADPGFTEAEYQTMYTNYEANLNIRGTGAIIAAPDEETPGGDYRFHWMRDAGLSAKAWMDVNNNDYEAVKEVMEGYAKWTGIVQHKEDPNCDVRIEPKFTIDDQEPYSGGWCRPQTDGPALRAMSMAKWGNILIDAGKEDEAKTVIWPLIEYDLDWVLTGWPETGCDLWEEVRSDDFFWNRMAFIYCLGVAADFSDRIGESMGDTYRATAEDIKAVVTDHWNGDYLYESTNRPDDGATIHAITTFARGVGFYTPDSEEAASTIQYLVRAFCKEYPINQESNSNGEPGILIGRYPNDGYAGGNPWQLLTAVTAECFYVGAQITYKKIRERGDDYYLSLEENKKWMELLKLKNSTTAQDLARAQVSAGDAVMTRLHNYVKADGGKIDEQIDKHTGLQASAEHLTWSYANILHALHIRKDLSPDPPGPPTTTSGPGPTGPTTGPGPTDAPPESCCSSVKLESSGAIASASPGALGSYRQVGADETGRAVYRKDDLYLHYVNDVAHKFEAWVFSGSSDDLMGEIVNEDNNECADATGATWEVLQDNNWVSDASAKVTCDGNAACCSNIIVSSTGGVSTNYPEMLGTYRQDFDASSEYPVYTKEEHSLFYLDDVLHHFKGWTLSESQKEIGPITNEGEAPCAEKADGGWEYLDPGLNSWQSDPSLRLECVEIAECCQEVEVASSGEASQRFPELMGLYSLSGELQQGRPVYTSQADTGVQLSYLNDVGHHWAGWVLGSGPGLGSLSNDEDGDCPSGLSAAWDVSDGGESWVGDTSLSVTCQ